jgi:hypothetical protein
MINNKIETTLIKIIPESITLKKYYPGKTNEQTITICNNCNIPLILSLISSDSSMLILKESSIKIGVNQKKALSFIISDKNYVKNKKNLKKPKKLFIFIKNDLLEEKFEIILSYNTLDNLSFSENKNMKSKNFFSFNKQNKKTKLFSNEKKKIRGFKKNNNFINAIKNNMKVESCNNRLHLLNTENYNNNNEKANESEYLNNAVLEMRSQISYLKQMLEHSQMKINQLQNQNYHFVNLMEEKPISFFIIGNKNKDIKYKKYEFVNPQRELYQYQDLIKNEDNKFNNMVTYLENKFLSKEPVLRCRNNNFHQNQNYIINNYNYI